MPKKLTTEDFIIKSKIKHGDRYDYSKVCYKGSNFKVEIVCKKHGSFFQNASSHMKGVNCPKCNKKSFYYNSEKAIGILKKVHGDTYDYSKLIYTGANEKIKIICKKHGQFNQIYAIHKLGSICPKCSRENSRLTTKAFIIKSIKIHGKFYNYTKTEYITAIQKVIIVCPIHGSFKQNPNDHTNGQGCYKCGRETLSKKLKENPNGWTYTAWKKAGERSKNFDSFKVYIIRCWNKNEEFYKIGKTFRTIKNRFKDNKSKFMPYNYEIVKIFEGEARKMSELENKLKRENMHFKYTPTVKFCGMYECYETLTNILDYLK